MNSAHFDLAALLLKMVRPEKALRESEEAIRLDGSYARAYFEPGPACEAKGDLRAQAACEKPPLGRGQSAKVKTHASPGHPCA